MVSSPDVYAIILAGGSGTRFWPVSRQACPKQFLALSGKEESLIQATARRIAPLLSSESEVSNGKLMVVTNSELADQVKRHVPAALVISEPFGRNTAASIGLAALEVSLRNPESIMIILPADHSVAQEQTLRDVLSTAIDVACKEDALVTIGIKPEFPNTAYGYIQRGEMKSKSTYMVARFFEKPNQERAKDYCDAGNFYWNSGMFVWKASTILQAFSEHMPELSKALAAIKADLGTPSEKVTLEREFKILESVSIDIGVLEHAHNCMVVEAEAFGWNDVGSWDAWAQHFPADKHGNISSGDVLAVQSKDCISYGSSDGKRVIALLGVEDIVIVDTPDALLICNRSKVQDVKLVVDALRKNGRTDLL